MTTWIFNDVNLTDFDIAGGRAIEDLSGSYDMPAPRGENQTVPLKEGRIYVPKYHDQREMTFGMWVSGYTPSAFDQQVDDLKKLLYSGYNLLEREDDSGNVRSAMAEVRGPLQFMKVGKTAGKCTVTFLLPDPFFYGDTQVDVSQEITTNPIEFVVAHPGTAPARKAVLTLDGPAANPTLITNLTTGVWLSYAGSLLNTDSLVVDCGAFTALKGSSNVIALLRHAGDSAFMYLMPGDNTFRVQSATTGGSLRVAFYPPYL
jgi:hypothetical protein